MSVENIALDADHFYSVLAAIHTQLLQHSSCLSSIDEGVSHAKPYPKLSS